MLSRIENTFSIQCIENVFSGNSKKIIKKSIKIRAFFALLSLLTRPSWHGRTPVKHQIQRLRWLYVDYLFCLCSFLFYALLPQSPRRHLSALNLDLHPPSPRRHFTALNRDPRPPVSNTSLYSSQPRSTPPVSKTPR